MSEHTTQTARETIDTLARELIDPMTPEFSVAIDDATYQRVLERADELELRDVA